MAFYYGHPQNRFWPLMAALTGEPVPDREDIEAKKQIILRHGLALWDTIGACDITGRVGCVHPQRAVQRYGRSAQRPLGRCSATGHGYRIYARYPQPVTGIATVLPSTSPANAACVQDRLRQAWGASPGTIFTNGRLKPGSCLF